MEILRILKQNSSLPTREIAKLARIPITTVHNRIKKLKDEGVITKFTIEVDNKKLGKGMSAYILVSADLKTLKEKKKTQYDILNQLYRIPNVEKADIVTGGTDIVLFIRFGSIEELDKVLLGKIQTIDGIINTRTLTVIH